MCSYLLVHILLKLINLISTQQKDVWAYYYIAKYEMYNMLTYFEVSNVMNFIVI